MSEIKIFDLIKYGEDKEVRLENLSIIDCRIDSSHYNRIIFIKCTFENVVFEGHYEDGEGSVIFIECKAKQCVFYGNLGKTYVELRDNIFKNCMFENIIMEWRGEQSTIKENGFFECTFKNMKLDRDIEFISQTICGGTIEDIYFLSSNMVENQFLNLQMNNTQIMAYFTDNIMASVIFKNVTLEWEIDENYDDGNLFYQCDTCGLICCRHEN